MNDVARLYDFAGKVVVITGGSRGIGHAMALAFARGWRACRGREPQARRL